MLRPDPLADSPARARTMAGRSKRSTRRAATMPTTPSCQPSPATTMAPAARISSGSASCWATAASRISRSTSRRSAFSSQSSAAIGSAVSRSGARSSSSARSACASRPAALMHGASVNPSARAPTVRGSMPAAAHSAAIPGRGRSRIARRPRATRRRLSPVSGTASATVARATRSIPSSGSGAIAPSSRRAASARTAMWTTPTAAGRSSAGRPRAGLAMMPGGRRPPARWWSSTIVSSPSSAARVSGLDGRRAAVDADQQAGAAVGEPLDGRLGDPVALGEAAGEEGLDARAPPAQRAHQDRGRRDAVAVVVAVHRDRLAAPDRARQAVGGLGDARQVLRRREGAVGRQELAGRRRVGQAAAHQRPGDRLGQAQGVAQRGDPGEVRPVGARQLTSAPSGRCRRRARPRARARR